RGAEDPRQDLPRNTVPTLILHGDADRILPADATSRRQAKMMKNARLVELKGGPHGVLWTHAEQINSELLMFLAKPAGGLRVRCWPSPPAGDTAPSPE